MPPSEPLTHRLAFGTAFDLTAPINKTLRHKQLISRWFSRLTSASCPTVNRTPQLQAEIDKLLKAKSMKVCDIIIDPGYRNNTHQGVYAIFPPGDGDPVYVGRTIGGKDGVAQRIWDHEHGISSLLRELRDPQNFGDFLVRTIAIQPPRFAGLVELFGIATLDPVANRP